MDAKDYDKIVDKLLQFRGKIPKSGHECDPREKIACKMMRDQTDDFILLLEEFAKIDEKGWLK